jgi:hypothetical protein
LIKNLKKLKKKIIEESSDSSNSSRSVAYSTDSMRDPPPKQKTRNEMKSQRNKKSIIKVHEREQTTKQHEGSTGVVWPGRV